jgi:tRNA(adenine34) deaminase
VSTGYAAGFEPAMRAALAEAAAAARDRPADVPVGAVLLDPAGTVIGRGRNEREKAQDPTAHAEVLAIRAAARARRGWRLDDCTLVVTLEPCTMCAGAVLAARIPRLVYGTADPRAGAAGSLWDVLRDRRLDQPAEVVGGVLAADCAALLRGFFAARRPAAGPGAPHGTGADPAESPDAAAEPGAPPDNS